MLKSGYHSCRRPEFSSQHLCWVAHNTVVPSLGDQRRVTIHCTLRHTCFHYTHTYTHTFTYIHSHILTQTHTQQSHFHIHSFTYTHSDTLNTHTHSYTHSYFHIPMIIVTHTHTVTFSLIPSYTHTLTYTHSDTLTYINPTPSPPARWKNSGLASRAVAHHWTSGITRCMRQVADDMPKAERLGWGRSPAWLRMMLVLH